MPVETKCQWMNNFLDESSLSHYMHLHYIIKMASFSCMDDCLI
uniref:Uncharacterized protein n=1 Tax=Rhizophora mucronata TaxID=61149 RepID=A0A2P2NAN4_RHIMU